MHGGATQKAVKVGLPLKPLGSAVQVGLPLHVREVARLLHGQAKDDWSERAVCRSQKSGRANFAIVGAKTNC